MAIIDQTIGAQFAPYDAATPLAQANQLQSQQAELQAAKFKQNQTEMGSEMRGLVPFVNTPEFPQKWAQSADKLLQRGVIDQQMHDQWATAPSPLLMKSIIAKTDTPEMAYNKDRAVQADKHTAFSEGIQSQELALAKSRDARANQTPLEAMRERSAAGEAAGLEPGTPAYTAYGLTGKLPDTTTLPNSAAEYEYYKKGFEPTAEQPKPMDYATFSTQKARAAATSVTTNVDTKAETEQSKEVGKALGKTQAADIEAGSHAAQTMRQLATLDNANKAGGDSVSGGPFGELVLKGKQGLNEIAGEDLTNAAPSEVIKKVGFGLATNLTKAITNRPAQMEFMKALENVPNLMMSKTGRIAMTSIMMQEKKAEQEIGRLASRHKDGSSGGPVWQEVKDKYYEDHPLISPFTGKPFSPDDVDMVVKSVPGGSSASTVAPGGLTRADVEAEIARRRAAQQ